MKNILKGYKGNSSVMVYGKPELMISEYCPIGSTFGGRTKDRSYGCNGVC